MPSYHSSTRSGVLLVPNAHSHTGATYISSGLAVAVLRLQKKNHPPSAGLFISCNASSVQRFRVAAICGVWAITATESAAVLNNALCCPLNAYVTYPWIFCLKRHSTGGR